MTARSTAGLLFRNMGFILVLAFVFGLTLPQGAIMTGPAVTPLLSVVMTLSVMQVSPRIFLDFKKVARPVFLTLLLNYAVLTFSIMGLATLLMPDYELWAGFVLLAAIPSAVAVIPFSYRLGGNIDFSLVGTVATYLAALVLLPLISIAFLGTNLMSPERLLITMGVLIAIPLGVSQLLRRSGVAAKIESYRGTIVNWLFFVVVYTIIGLNQSAFLGQPLTLLRVAAVSFVSLFVIGFIVERIAEKRGSDKPQRISLILLSTRKNYGMAAAVAIALFSPRVAIPAAVTTVFAVAHFVWLTFRVKRMI